MFSTSISSSEGGATAAIQVVEQRAHTAAIRSCFRLPNIESSLEISPVPVEKQRLRPDRNVHASPLSADGDCHLLLYPATSRDGGKAEVKRHGVTRRHVQRQSGIDLEQAGYRQRSAAVVPHLGFEIRFIG